ncbi:PorT family protein [Hymenobacter sp. 15J16-1T3B]|uniref:outer membrane beta-barrel protein n=1 Tax=Hymenobacter sp. 15J16-1T3B TaxID=2886941 RepID=UPI001D102298|nr:outer membrane beta-barrel protein [Hymenobacter sp. 15J16-1T3B]MCC3159187.1 PorT family protein [Hymenobacter sp. 15J16-1T3B]
MPFARIFPIAGLLLSLPSLATAQAQFTFGPCVGGGLSAVHYSAALPATTRAGRLAAYQLGAMLQLRYSRVALQSGLLVVTKGNHETNTYSFQAGGRTVEATATFRARYAYLELPLHVAYGPAWARGLQVFGGPYGAVGVGGRYHSEYQQFDEQGNYLGTQVNDSPVRYAGLFFQSGGPRTFDYGLNAGLGYARGRWLAQAQYSWGLCNLFGYARSADFRQYHRTAALTLTYWLLTP